MSYCNGDDDMDKPSITELLVAFGIIALIIGIAYSVAC